MRAWLAAAAVVMVLLAGCSGGDNGPLASPTSSSSSGSHAAATNSTSKAPAPNQAPTGTLATVPEGLNATFRLEGADADGDALSWNLTFGDGGQANGTALPANVTHAYAAAGAYDATFTLSDGRNATAYHALLNLTLAAAAAPVSFTGHVVGPDGSENSEGECVFALLDGTGAPPGWGGIAGDAFTLDGDYAGWSFGFDVDGMVAQFQNAGGYVGAKAASGTVPDGATSVLACSHSAVDTDYTLTLAPP